MHPQTSTKQTMFRIEPLRALRAISALSKDPDDLPQVFTIIESLSAGAPGRMWRKFKESVTGRKLLAERPDIVEILGDRAKLRAMPEGSLGRAYLAFVESEGISAQGIRDASVLGEKGDRPKQTEQEAELDYIHVRMRDTHDLWHAATGYKGDVLGEAALLAFAFAQTRNIGVGLIVLVAILKIGLEPGAGELREVIFDGFRRGRRSAWLPAVHWETLLALPVPEVRKLLNLDETPRYTPIRSSELRAQGAW